MSYQLLQCNGGQPNAAGKAYIPSFMIGRIVTVALLAIVLVAQAVGCSSRDPKKATSDPVAQVRLNWLTRFYRMYAAKHGKPPANEKAFKEYIQSLPQNEKDAAGISGDLDSYMVSPNDGQKYHIQYGTRTEGANRAFAWEENGLEGKRYVALTMGYVKQCDENTFQSYKNRK